MTQQITRTGLDQAVKQSPRKWVYLFAEGNATMRDLLGGKGAGVSEMTNADLPVPPDLPLPPRRVMPIMTPASSFHRECGSRHWPHSKLLSSKREKASARRITPCSSPY